MLSDYRCFFCYSRAIEKLLDKEKINNEEKNFFINKMLKLYLSNRNDLNSPSFSRELHNLFKKFTHNSDPYKNQKKESNDQAMSMVTEFKNLIYNSENSFDVALRLVIAGNVIDFAANENFNLKSTIDKVLISDFAIDHSTQLKKAVENAGTVVYLGDNAGEVVFDKLFIETINHPDLTYVVRGGPVINDATLEDARYVGMTNSVKVISNGYDAPSTVLNKSSKEFRHFFNKADLIISKGQGNLEGLLPLKDNRIFFLLMVKCNVMADLLNVPKDSFVVFNSQYMNA